MNELVLRCKGKLEVSFEPNSIVFEYGDRALRKPKATEHGYIKNEAVRRGFAIQDEQLNDVEKVKNGGHVVVVFKHGANLDCEKASDDGPRHGRGAR